MSHHPRIGLSMRVIVTTGLLCSLAGTTVAQDVASESIEELRKILNPCEHWKENLPPGVSVVEERRLTRSADSDPDLPDRTVIVYTLSDGSSGQTSCGSGMAGKSPPSVAIPNREQGTYTVRRLTPEEIDASEARKERPQAVREIACIIPSEMEEHVAYSVAAELVDGSVELTTEMRCGPAEPATEFRPTFDWATRTCVVRELAPERVGKFTPEERVRSVRRESEVKEGWCRDILWLHPKDKEA